MDDLKHRLPPDATAADGTAEYTGVTPIESTLAKCYGCGSYYDPMWAGATCSVCDGTIVLPMEAARALGGPPAAPPVPAKPRLRPTYVRPKCPRCGRAHAIFYRMRTDDYVCRPCGHTGTAEEFGTAEVK